MRKKTRDKVWMKGFMRVQLVEKDGRVVGDSGMLGPNQVVNLGFQDYVCKTLAGLSGSKTISHMAIGTGTVPGAAATSLDGETAVRVTTTNTVVASKTLQATCQFAGSDMSGTCTIQNVGLYNTSATGTLIAGMTYATSQWASNQNVRNLHQAMATLFRKLREFGEHLSEKIPSRALIFIKEGVTTMHEALVRGEDIVWSLWRHKEQSRNDFALI